MSNKVTSPGKLPWLSPERLHWTANFVNLPQSEASSAAKRVSILDLDAHN